MQPYTRADRVYEARDLHHTIGLTKSHTKRALAAKKRNKHGARQEMKQEVKKDSWEAVFGHLGTPEEVAQEWIEMQEELARYKLREKVQALKDGAANERAQSAILAGKVGRLCVRCFLGKLFLDTNGYNHFLRCNHCHHVPMEQYD